MSGWLGTVTQIAGLVVDVVKATDTHGTVRRIRLQIAEERRKARAAAEKAREEARRP